jgi:hypothetical protein
LFSLTTKNSLSIEMLLFLIASASTKRCRRGELAAVSIRRDWRGIGGVRISTMRLEHWLGALQLLQCSPRFEVPGNPPRTFSVSENCSSMVLNRSVCERVDRLAQEESLPRLGV